MTYEVQKVRTLTSLAIKTLLQEVEAAREQGKTIKLAHYIIGEARERLESQIEMDDEDEVIQFLTKFVEKENNYAAQNPDKILESEQLMFSKDKKIPLQNRVVDFFNEVKFLLRNARKTDILNQEYMKKVLSRIIVKKLPSAFLLDEKDLERNLTWNDIDKLNEIVMSRVEIAEKNFEREITEDKKSGTVMKLGRITNTNKKQCSFCHKMGHVEDNCWAKQRKHSTQPYSRPSGQRNEPKPTLEKRNENKMSRQMPQISELQVASKKRIKENEADIRLTDNNNVAFVVKGRLDSGVDVNVLPRSYVTRAIKQRPGTPLMFEFPNKMAFKSAEKAMLVTHVILPSKKIFPMRELWFYVVDDEQCDEVLIGKNTLEYFGISPIQAAERQISELELMENKLKVE
jgi:hypothetical protein